LLLGSAYTAKNLGWFNLNWVASVAV